jgi:uncharacterized protein YeaO (DUF488 family)
MKAINIKRVYDSPAASDGKRVLVDRLWPRGLAREEARIDVWMKEIAPSAELRRWYGHDVEKWPQFRTRYLDELSQNPAAEELKGLATKSKTLTLLFAAKDGVHNNAAVLREFLLGSAAQR